MRCFQNIAKLIRTKRLNHPKSYSQSELSHLLGYKNGQFISNVERALCNIPLKMLRRVSEILDITAEELKLSILKDQENTLNSYLYGNVKKRGEDHSAKTDTESNGADAEVHQLDEKRRKSGDGSGNKNDDYYKKDVA